MNLQDFQDKVIKEGSRLYRDMPWRKTRDPYRILLSEIMLQQTQVDRVIGYYERFVKEFPRIEDLARAPFSKILGLWSGLGYNRRAKWLQESAQKIVSDFDGKVPNRIEDLILLPGIGHNTAAAICVYAYGKSENFVETNIHTVYIFHMFNDDKEAVRDGAILKLQEKILQSGLDPRTWYLSLMDYGTYLKKEHGNLSKKSHSYKKQSKFQGSVRQVRGALLKLFIQKSLLDLDTVNKSLEHYDIKLRNDALSQLINEGFIVKDGNNTYCLKK